MHTVLPLSLIGVIAAAVIFMGSNYLVSPDRVTGSFGLKLPAADADTRAWLRLKGVRDVGAGFAVLALMVFADRRALGIAVLALAIIPFGDMAVVLGSGGSKASAFWIHGLTCAVMLFVGLLLIHTV